MYLVFFETVPLQGNPLLRNPILLSLCYLEPLDCYAVSASCPPSLNYLLHHILHQEANMGSSVSFGEQLSTFVE